MQALQKFFSILFSIIVPMLSPEFGLAADNTVHLRLGTLGLQSGSIFQLAKDFGYFSEEGLTTEFLFFPSAQKTALAVASNDLDFGLTGLTAATYNLAGLGKLKLIAGNFRERPGWEGEALVVSNKAWDKGLRHPGQLAKYSVAVTDIGSTLHYIVGMIADKYRFPPDRFKPIPLHGFPEILAALATGSVDSSIVPSMMAHTMEEDKNGHIIGWISAEFPWQVTGLMVSSRLLTQDRVIVEKFLRAYRKAIRLYHESFNQIPPKANLRNLHDKKQPLYRVIKSMVQFTAPLMSAEEIVRYPVYMDREARLDLESVDAQLRWYQDRGIVNRRVTLEQVIDRTLVIPLTMP